MNGVLGSIEIQMMADLSRLRRDMTDAKSLVGGSMTSIKNSVVGAMGALAAGMSVAAFTSWIKAAIDAADVTDDLAKRAGVAVKDVAGLQLAFKFAGVESGVMTTSLVMLAKNVAAGSDVFDRMGVSVLGADGKLKSSKQVLYDVADVFERMEPGIARTALATEVFGKAGADLMPMLSSGSDGLREMADMAERLGLVISQETADAAGEFNDTLDLLAMASDGVATQVAAALLPTLKGLAGTMLDNVTSGDKLAAAAEFISNALKVLFTVGAVGVEVFNTLGKTIGGVAAAVVSVAQGEFSQAKTILEETGRDITKGWGDTAKTVSDAWSGAGAATVDQANAMTKALGGTSVATKAQAEESTKLAAEHKKQAAEQEKLTKAGADYVLSIESQYAAMQQQIAAGRDLTDGEKALIKMEEDLAKGKMVLTAAEKASVISKLSEIDATKEQKKQADDYAKLLATVAAHSNKWAEEQGKTTESLRSGNVALIEENEKLRIGETAWAARQATVMLNQAADLEWQAANEGGNFQLEEQARLLRERATLVADGTALREAQAVSDEWQKTADSIGQGLTDSLFRAFEAGKGFFQTLWDGIVDLFKTTAIKLIVQPVQQYMNGAINSVINSGSNYAGSAVSSGLGSLTGTVGNLWSGGGALGTVSAVGNYGAVYTGAAYGTGFGTQQSAMLAAQEAGMTSSAGSSAMGTMGMWAGVAVAAVLGVLKANGDWNEGFRRDQAKDVSDRSGLYFAGGMESDMANFLSKMGISDKWADLLTGATAVAKIFGNAAPQIYEQGIEGSIGYGSTSTRMFANTNAEGGLLSRDKKATIYGATGAEIEAVLNHQAAATLSAVEKWGKALGLPTQQLGAVFTDLRVLMTGDAKTDAEAITTAFEQYATDLIASFGGVLSEFQKSGETLEDTMKRLLVLQEFTENINSLGGVFSHVALLSVSAKEQLIEFAGGMEALNAKASSFVANYYSAEEQGGLASKGILKALSDVGVDASQISTRAEFRALVEWVGISGNLENEAGQKQLAVLLNVADSFASLTDYMSESGVSLGELAALAPESATLQGLVAGDTERTAAATETIVTIGGSLVDLVTDLIDSVQAGLAATTAATQATTNLLESWDGGGYLTTTAP